MRVLPMYPREQIRVGALALQQSTPTCRPAPTGQFLPRLRPHLVPSTQLQRNAQSASHVQVRPSTTTASSPVAMRTPAKPGPTNGPQPRLDVTGRLGQRIRRLRVERNMTQTRMAEEFGLDRTYLSDLECGRKSVTLPTLDTIARGFKMSLSELFEDV